ncbi:MAG: TPM domain-containing protein [Cyanobacteria bacterium SBLK]|nr:TPM domain-containing protein [Cyanobacteria bacterium SBLK]
MALVGKNCSQKRRAIAIFGKYALSSILTACLLVFPLTSLALNIGDVPNPQQQYGGWVTDMAGILSSDTEARLNQNIAALEAKNGTEIAVVTVPKTQPATTPKAFATHLFNHWGIGKKEENNGVLFLVSTGDRRVEIEIGSGLHNILTKPRLDRIIQTEIVPQFKQGNFENGVLRGTSSLIHILESSSVHAIAPIIWLSILLFLVAGALYFLAKWVAKQPVFLPATENQNLGATDPLDRNVYLIFGFGLFWFCLALSQIAIASGFGLQNVSVGVLAIGSLLSFPISGWGAKKFARKVFKQQGNLLIRPPYCTTCQQPFHNLSDNLSALLTPPEQTARRIKSVDYEGWRCRTCFPDSFSRPHLHFRRYQRDRNKFKTCPHCQELTVTRTAFRRISQPTYSAAGLAEAIEKCHCCSYSKTISRIIPRRIRSSSSSRYSGGSSYEGSGCSGSSSSYGGESYGGGSSDFGGGDSDGGGCGGDW